MGKAGKQDDAFEYPGKALERGWPRLHRGDCEPFPASEKLQQAWRLFHAGHFEEATTVGLALGIAGANVACKATVMRATYLVSDEALRATLLEDAAHAVAHAMEARPKDPNAHHLHGLALGRYSRVISVMRALAQGLGPRVRDAFKHALELEPRHAEAHVALAAYHAEVVAKVGALVGRLTYGATADAAIEHFQRAAELFPESPIVRLEHGDALLKLFGEARRADADRLYREASKLVPADACERHDMEIARARLTPKRA
jgi:tetratricopeptide (TPR) repeat protein